MTKLVVVVAIIMPVLTFMPTPGQSAQRQALIDFGTYTFQNVGDLGFLTAVGGSENIVTDTWRDIPGQKWKVTRGYLFTSYMMKPLSEGLESKVAMSIFTKNGTTVVKKEGYTFGLASALYWSVLPAEGSFYLIQNLQSDDCLESNGPGQPVTVSLCKSNKSQQWSVHSR